MFKTLNKIHYLNCPSHPGELLSQVCVDKGNKLQRLVCAMCEHTSFQTSTVLPLKTIIQSVQQSELQETEGMNVLEIAMFLDRAHLDCLKAITKLQDQVTSMTQLISSKINDYYTNLKNQLKGFADKQVPQHFLLDYFYSKQYIHEDNIQRVNGYLNQLIQTHSINEQGSVCKLNIYQGIMDQCSNKFNELSEKIIEIQTELDKKADLIKKTFQPSVIQPVEQYPVVAGQTSFFFSPTFKGANIQLSSNNLVAEQKSAESNGQRFVICEPQIPKGGKTQFAFKIQKYSGWVGIGVCHKSVIQTAGYKFNYTAIGHGSYLISNNAYSWSHLQKELNSSNKSFDFGVGDIVYIQIDYVSRTIIWKKNNTASTYTMKIDTNEELSPCANLCSPGDIVELINKVDIKF